MNDEIFDKKKTTKYLIWTFLITWFIQIMVAILYRKGLIIVGKLLIAIIMFVPLLGVLLSGQTFGGMGWKPHLKGKIKFLLIAWFLPSFLTAIGAALYFVVFPEHFDTSGEYFIANAGAELLEQLKAQGITYPVYILITAIGCLTYAPLFNMLLAVGEEAGWRGFLYPQLKEKFGKRQGWLIGGIIWAIWHWPLIWLIGYEYGTNYIGFPILGMLIFCIFTTTAGIICDWLYEKTKCIWIPSIFHGAYNAAATLPLVFCTLNTGSACLLGPAPMGILAGLPATICGMIVFFKAGKPNES